MRQQDTLRYEMLVRVRDFGAARTELFPADALGGRMFAEVNTAVVRLDQHTATEVSGSGAALEGSTAKAAARQSLVGQLEAINRTARALAIETPDLDGKFRVPSRKGDQTLLSTARAFAQDAAPLAGEFIAHAMPANFLDELRSGIAGFEQSMHGRDAGKGTRLAARAGIDAEMDAALVAVRKLDAIVANTLRHDPVNATVWERIRHVERMPRAAASPALAPAAASATPVAADPATTPAAPATPASTTASPA